jgi:hypothetical protein
MQRSHTLLTPTPGAWAVPRAAGMLLAREEGQPVNPEVFGAGSRAGRHDGAAPGGDTVLAINDGEVD